MKEREKLVVSGLVALLMILWLGFLFHESPRFAGSLWGGVFGVAGSLLMLVPLAYSFAKRVDGIKKWLKPKVSMRTLLAWHIYAGILGPILVIVHTGHKFESLLGVALTSTVIIVALSGFVGRYLMNQITKEIRKERETLNSLGAAYEEATREISLDPVEQQRIRRFSGFWSRFAAGFFLETPESPAGAFGSEARAFRLAESMADVEYAVKTHQSFKRWFKKWLQLHIVISAILYLLMALHIWSSVHFGLRWFS